MEIERDNCALRLTRARSLVEEVAVIARTWIFQECSLCFNIHGSLDSFFLFLMLSEVTL